MENEESRKQNEEDRNKEKPKTSYPYKNPWEEGSHFDHPQFQPKHPNPRLAGLIILIVGLFLLLNRIPETAQWLPKWLFTWPVIVIVIGIFIGVKHHFRNGIAWIIPVIVGLVFLLKEEIFLSETMQNLTVPILVIIAGILIMLNRNRHRRCPQYWDQRNFQRNHRRFQHTHRRGNAQFTENSTEDFIDVNSTFGNVVKRVVSKKFKGGNINCSFGGTELDLTQSDIQETITLNLSVTFGGVDISVPSNWNIKNNVNVMLGGVDDKRRQVTQSEESPKTLILTGNITCGGLEIKN